MTALPGMLGDPFTGLLAAVVLYAIGGGIIEVLTSPIVEACPTKKKEAAMSLLHSFYCWGHLAVVLLSTAFFTLVGIEHWLTLALLWSVVPVLNIFYFSQVPIYPIAPDQEKVSLGGLLSSKMFWFFIMLMVCAGASEQGMSQWASAFAESVLHLSKTAGDLAGPCAFALFMGTARALYGRFSGHIPLRKVMSASAALCIGCYLLAVFAPHPVLGLIGCALCGFSVGIFWPGTFSMAAKVLPAGGTAMYALMALAGGSGMFRRTGAGGACGWVRKRRAESGRPGCGGVPDFDAGRTGRHVETRPERISLHKRSLPDLVPAMGEMDAAIGSEPMAAVLL